MWTKRVHQWRPWLCNWMGFCGSAAMYRVSLLSLEKEQSNQFKPMGGSALLKASNVVILYCASTWELFTFSCWPRSTLKYLDSKVCSIRDSACGYWLTYNFSLRLSICLRMIGWSSHALVLIPCSLKMSADRFNEDRKCIAYNLKECLSNDPAFLLIVLSVMAWITLSTWWYVHKSIS